MEKKIGAIQQGVPSAELERALLAWQDGAFSPAYSMEIASCLSTGQARQKKIATVINAIILRNPMVKYLMERNYDLRLLLRDGKSRPLILTAMVCSAFPFAYDVASIMGKYFHAETQLAKGFIRQKVSCIYGGNRTVDIALKAVIPMLVDFGMVNMPENGIFTINRQSKFADAALDIYKKSFLVNNPTYTDNDDFMSNPYFEFIND